MVTGAPATAAARFGPGTSEVVDGREKVRGG
jgi:hypothetical protein